jgi:hypothetical protein
VCSNGSKRNKSLYNAPGDGSIMVVNGSKNTIRFFRLFDLFSRERLILLDFSTFFIFLIYVHFNLKPIQESAILVTHADEFKEDFENEPSLNVSEQRRYLDKIPPKFKRKKPSI